jgi:hypothetical protein
MADVPITSSCMCRHAELELSECCRMGTAPSARGEHAEGLTRHRGSGK